MCVTLFFWALGDKTLLRILAEPRPVPKHIFGSALLGVASRFRPRSSHSLPLWETKACHTLTVAFDVSSSQRAFWRASVGASSCKRPNKSVMTPFTFANGSSPVPASNFQISKCARRAEQARQSSYLATRLIIDTTSNPARCVDVSHQQLKLS